MSDHLSFDATRLTRLARVKSVAPSADQRWLAVEVAQLDADEIRYRTALWRVSLTDPSAPPIRLTAGEWNDDTPRFRRDGSLAFLSNRPRRPGRVEPGETDRKQVWVLPAHGGEPQPITDEPLGVLDFQFARSADRLVVIAPVLPEVAPENQRAAAAERRERGPTGLRFTRMPIRFWDHWLEPAAVHVIAYAADGTDRRDLTPRADREYRPVGMPEITWDLSADGRRVAIPASRPGRDRIEDMSIHVLDCATGELIELGAGTRLFFGAPVFAPDSQRIACWRLAREDGRCGRQGLWMFESSTTASAGRPVAPDWDVWPTPKAWTDDGTAVIAAAEVGGAVPVFRVDVAAGEIERITAESAVGCHDGLHVVGSSVVGLRHRLVHPPEPFRVDLAPGAEPSLLASLSGFSPQDGERIARVESFSVAGDGGTPVQSFLVKPAAATAPAPALVWIHGGPIGQNADGWHWRWNPLIPVAAGYAVALPNPRGSTGFGQEMIEGIWNNEWGGACYRDLMAVTDAVVARRDIDGSRVGAMGGSFGGYMANWIGASTDRFRCLISHAGIYHLGAFFGTTDHPGWFAYEMCLTPDQDEDAFERYSPHRGIARWKTPTLIIHGERDYRVPVSEALLLFEDLDRRGVPAELLVFPDENHWVLKPQNTRQWYATVLEFLDRHV